MASGDAEGRERTEQPSARRREEARRKGQVAKSQDLTAAVWLLGAAGAHALAGQHLVGQAVAALRQGLQPDLRIELTLDEAAVVLLRAIVAGVTLVWPFLLLPAVIALAAHLAQTRLVLATEAISPQWNRVDPIAGLGRLLSGRSLVELLKSVVKLLTVGGVAVVTLRADWSLLAALGQDGAAGALAALGQVVWDLWVRVALAYLVIGGADYGYQWWQLEKSLRMTREEVREETRQSEGDPLLRGRMKSLHRQRAQRRMMAEVKRADVVLRNPSHVAVALAYDSRRMGAPRVVGKGEHLLALRIIEVARAHAVPVVENPPLARALNRAVAIGREIPPDLYRAVAEVLAYVYALTGRRR